MSDPTPQHIQAALARAKELVQGEGFDLMRALAESTTTAQCEGIQGFKVFAGVRESNPGLPPHHRHQESRGRVGRGDQAGDRMSRRKPLTPEIKERLKSGIVVVCDQDPRGRGRVNKLQTFFLDNGKWQAVFPGSSLVEDEFGVKHVFHCKLCKAHVVVSESKVNAVLDVLNANGISRITLPWLNSAVRKTSEAGVNA